MEPEITNEISTGRELRPVEIKVWDRFVRVFHWSLVILFATAYLTRDTYEQVHIAAGYGVLALVVMRIVWGFIGSEHARFRDFIYTPATVIQFLFDTMRFRARRYLGHNPAGGAMVAALLLSMLTICGSGIVMTLDAFWGVKWIETIHDWATNLTLILLAFHVLGVILASLEHRENLVKSMFTGRKRK